MPSFEYDYTLPNGYIPSERYDLSLFGQQPPEVTSGWWDNGQLVYPTFGDFEQVFGAGPTMGQDAESFLPATFSTPANAYPSPVDDGIHGQGADGGGGNSLLNFLKQMLGGGGSGGGSNASKIAQAGIAGLGALLGSRQKNVLDDATVQQLLQMSLKRQQRTDPLHESVTQLAMAMMPTAYQKKV